MKTPPSFDAAFLNTDLTSTGVVGSEPSATPVSIAAATTPGGPGERKQVSRLDEAAFLKAVPAKGENLSGRAIHLGALAHKDFKAGKNPAGWAVDEDLWDRAKEAASKSYDMADDAFWPVVATIYEKMGGTIGEANVSLESALVNVGDLPGHEFRGNQWTEAGANARSKSDEAMNAGSIAHGIKTAESHEAAVRAHRDAMVAHQRASRDPNNNVDQMNYHKAMVGFHEDVMNKHQSASNRASRFGAR